MYGDTWCNDFGDICYDRKLTDPNDPLRINGTLYCYVAQYACNNTYVAMIQPNFELYCYSAQYSCYNGEFIIQNAGTIRCYSQDYTCVDVSYFILINVIISLFTFFFFFFWIIGNF